MGQNWAQNYVFCFFLKFGSLVLFNIAYDDSLGQCLATNRGKMYIKFIGVQIWTKRTNIGPKVVVVFFLHFLKFGLLVFLEIA